jgi:hypothetical protein
LSKDEMNIKLPKFQSGINAILSINLVILLMLANGLPKRIVEDNVQSSALYPQVNVPELTGVPFTPAIFWFGKVDQTNNYADVRILFYDPYYIKIVLHIIDRQLWYDTTGTISQLNQWDAVSIYLNLDGNVGSSPGPDSYLFELQLTSDLQASYRGNGSAWITATIPTNSHTEYRGASGPNSGSDSEGWVAYFEIPFSGLGLQAAPSPGTIWGLGITLHDRDNASGSIFQETYWPETMAPNVPTTWGRLSFGWPNFSPQAAVPMGTVTIRQGLNGASVVDGEVGGHTTCGNDGYNKWTAWGNANYAGINQINIQNQWDISDWPCFSKFYVTFPITAIPPGYTIISATLTMNLFGTAGGGQWGTPPDSYIEVLTVDSDWDEATLTWNNAPLATENISGTWVPPVVGDYHWDVGSAVDRAYRTGEPIRLAIYSIDGERHSGKYFYSSDSSDWNGEIRPTLRIVYGKFCDSPGVTCYKTYFPLALK